MLLISELVIVCWSAFNAMGNWCSQHHFPIILNVKLFKVKTCAAIVMGEKKYWDECKKYLFLHGDVILLNCMLRFFSSKSHPSGCTVAVNWLQISNNSNKQTSHSEFWWVCWTPKMHWREREPHRSSSFNFLAPLSVG